MSTLHDNIYWAFLIFGKAFFSDVSLKPTIKWFSVVKYKTATKSRQSRSWETTIRFPARSDEEVTSNMAIVHGSQKYLLIFLLSVKILVVDLLYHQRPKKVTDMLILLEYMIQRQLVDIFTIDITNDHKKKYRSHSHIQEPIQHLKYLLGHTKWSEIRQLENNTHYWSTSTDSAINLPLSSQPPACK